MRRRVAFLFFAAVFGLVVVASAKASRPEKLKYPPLEFNLPKTERVVLSNGMVLHLLENHELPIVEIGSMVRIGSAYEPEGEMGLASLIGAVWRSGGTTSLSPEELDEKLEFMGASIETSIDAVSGTISLSVLKRDMEAGLKLFADVIKNPAFDENRFAVAKSAMLEGIKRENDDPNEIARREFRRAVLPDHPFGRWPTLESVGGITAEDCKRFYMGHVGPESFIIGVSGDFDSKDMVARFEKLFADFKPVKKKLPDIKPVPDSVMPGVYLVDKKLPQTVIRAGHMGISVKNPDYYGVKVMNFILGGGGFSSRMMKEIRTTRGLAYSVWSYYVWGERDKGLFLAGGETKTSTTVEFLNTSRQIMRDIIAAGVTEEELSLAKDSIVNSFVFGFDKDSKIVSQYLWVDFFGMPEDYLERFRDNIGKVTRADVKEVASKYLHPDKMVIVAVGDTAEMGSGMGEMGPVRNIELEGK